MAANTGGDWHADDCQCSAWCRGDYTVTDPTTSNGNGNGNGGGR